MIRAADIQAAYYLTAVGIVIAAAMITKKWGRGLYAGYLFLVLAVTLLSRRTAPEMQLQLKPFWSYAEWARLGEQVIANVILFIPVGFLLGWEIGRKAIPAAALHSAAIELLQLVTRRGLCELDDVIHNTLGAVIGVLLAKIIDSLLQRLRASRRNQSAFMIETERRKNDEK